MKFKGREQEKEREEKKRERETEKITTFKNRIDAYNEKKKKD